MRLIENSSAILNPDVRSKEQAFKMTNNQRNFDSCRWSQHRAANGLALSGAGTSAGTVMTKLGSCIHGLGQKRRNSSALAMELPLSCTNPLIYNLRAALEGLTLFILNTETPIQVRKYFYIEPGPRIQIQIN